MKAPEPENVIIVLLIIAFIVFALVILNGCMPSTKARNMRMIWHDGNCMLYAEGISVVQAKELEEEWRFKACEVTVKDKE